MFGNVHAKDFLWTSMDTRNAVLNSIIPTGIGMYYYMSSKPGGAYNHVYEVSLFPVDVPNSDFSFLEYQQTRLFAISSIIIRYT